MKIKTLAIVALSALSLSSTAALAATTTVNGGTVHFKGEVVNAACAVDAGSLDQTVMLVRYVQQNWLPLAAPALPLDSISSWMIATPPFQQKHLLLSLAQRLIAPTQPCWPCRTLQRVAQPTLAYRSSTAQAPRWHWMARPSAKPLS